MDRPRRTPRLVDLKLLSQKRREAMDAPRVLPAAVPDPPERREGERRARIAAVFGAAIVVSLAVFGYYLHVTEPGRALRRLPAAERAALHRRTLATLREVCEPVPPRALRPFCKEQAAVVLELPECDEACRELAGRHLTQPTR